MLNILASGTLVSDPVARTSAKGKPFATGTMRVPSEDADPVLMSLIAFSSTAVDTLLALTKGEALAVVGRAKLTAWEKNGEQHHGLSMVADQVMTVYQADKRRKRAAGGEGGQPDE